MIRYLILLMVLVPRLAFADHLPESQLPTSSTETSLAGIDIHHSHAKELLKTLGTPTSYKKYPETEDAAEIIWDKDGSIIHATINADDVAYAVEVTGNAGPLAKTHAGLSLGDSVADIKRLYSRKFRYEDDAEGRRILILQWQDETELRVRFSNGKIVSLMLVASQA